MQNLFDTHYFITLEKKTLETISSISTHFYLLTIFDCELWIIAVPRMTFLLLLGISNPQFLIDNGSFRVWIKNHILFFNTVKSGLLISRREGLPYRLDIYKLLNIKSSRTVQVAAATGLAQEFRIVLPAKVWNKNSTRSVYSHLLTTYSKSLMPCKKVYKKFSGRASIKVGPG